MENSECRIQNDFVGEMDASVRNDDFLAVWGVMLGAERESPVTPCGESAVVVVSGRRATPLEKEGSLFGQKFVLPYRKTKALVI